MRPFNNYGNNFAHYYDLFYQDKDYAAEAQYIHKLLQNYKPDMQSLLELGCGTGTHTALLAAGYKIHGVDLSVHMLERAESRLAKLPSEQASRLVFSQGDIRNIRLGNRFDGVISLFNVMSYQTTYDDLKAAFITAKTHLNSGGIFIFDCWYGPSVLTDPPVVRVKQVEDEVNSVTRIAEPLMHPNENLVDVNYQVFVKDKASGAIEEFWETHRMRYLFKPEVELLLGEVGFEDVKCNSGMTDREPGFDTWSVYFKCVI